jgi:hypothetical protein
MKKALVVVFFAGCLLSLAGVSYAQNQFIDQFQIVMGAAPASGSEVLDIVRSVAGYLIVLGGIAAGIAIIASGLLYMAAASNTSRLATAKAVFKNGVIGALILFAAGLIVNTIILLAVNWQQFFQ